MDVEASVEHAVPKFAFINWAVTTHPKGLLSEESKPPAR